MRIFWVLLLLPLITQCQEEADENSEDVFEIQMSSGSDDDMVTAESENPGMDGFVTSTEMIELNDTSLEVKEVSKANLFTPITPLDPEAVFHNFSTATFDMDSEEDDESNETRNEATTFSIPIEEVVADRRVLKEKEPTRKEVIISTTTAVSTSSADLATEVDENETPFDQSALEGLFEPDGSPIVEPTAPLESPAFPIVKMTEEDTKILIDTTTVSPTTVPSTTVPMTTEATTTTTTMSTTEVPTTVPQQKMFALPAKSIKTPISIRITSLEFSEDFENLETGPAKKLIKDVGPRIAEYIQIISGDDEGDNVLGVDIKSFQPGSVIVAAEVATKKSLGDSQMTANLLEAAISRNASRLGGYTVDSLSVTVDGMTSQAYLDAISTSSRRDDDADATSLSSLILIVIAVSLIVITSVALCVIMISTKKRRQSTMKLSIENSVRSMTPESGTSPQHSVHLMSYGHRASTTQKTQIDETNSVMY